MVEGDQMIDGGPSVFDDAVVLLTSDTGMLDLLKELTARDFVADAFAHCKFIGYSASVLPLFEKAGIADSIDEGVTLLTEAKDVAPFIAELGRMRLWAREPNVKLK